MFSQVYCFGPESRGQEYKQHWVRQPSPEACLITAPRDPIVSGFLSTDLSSTAGCRVFRRQVATAAPWGAGAPVWAAGASGVWVGAGVPPAGGVPRLARAPSQRPSLLCVVLVEGMLPALTSVLRRRAGHRTPVLSRGGGGDVWLWRPSPPGPAGKGGHQQTCTKPPTVQGVREPKTGL